MSEHATPPQAPLPPNPTPGERKEERHLASPLKLTIALYSAMVLVALIIRAIYFQEPLPLNDLGLPPWEPLLAAIVGGLVVLAVSPWMERWAWVREIGQMVRRLFGRLRPRQALALGCASGIAEELLFRGALQPWLGVVPATVLFAVMHGIGWWGLFALIMGAGLAALYAWGDNLWPCIAAHVLINTVNLARIGRRADPVAEAEPVLAAASASR